MREQVELLEPPSRFGYTLLSGLPLRDYHAVVTLTDVGRGRAPTSTGSRASTSACAARDALFRLLVRKTLEDIATKLAREAERARRG